MRLGGLSGIVAISLQGRCQGDTGLPHMLVDADPEGIRHIRA